MPREANRLSVFQQPDEPVSEGAQVRATDAGKRGPECSDPNVPSELQQSDHPTPIAMLAWPTNVSANTANNME